MKRLPDRFYRKVLHALPILCVDIVIEYKGQYVLVKRKNRPEQNKWWVPGGRVLKGELLERAVKRKAREELGIGVDVVRSIGYFEGIYTQNDYGLRSGVHGVSVVFLARPRSLNIKLDAQSSAWKMSKKLPKRFQRHISI